MTQTEKRCIRQVTHKLAQALNDLVATALEGELRQHSRDEAVTMIRLAADQLERGHD